jgi:2-oxoglutarate ferredoxin oxidoreductase subunit beta
VTDLIGNDLNLTPLSKTAGVPTTDQPQKGKDFTSDQEVRWCPGCGDYVILNTIRNFLPELGLRRENIAFVSGIGCSSRFPYYLETYGFHSIHGRAPTIATWPWRVPTCRCGSSPVTATPCRSAATT